MDPRNSSCCYGNYKWGYPNKQQFGKKRVIVTMFIEIYLKLGEAFDLLIAIQM